MDRRRKKKETVKQDELFEAYSSGKITRSLLEEKTGLYFSEILEELGKRGLKLPRVDSTTHYNAKQRALYEEIFGAGSFLPLKKRNNPL